MLVDLRYEHKLFLVGLRFSQGFKLFSGRLNILACRPNVKYKLLLFGLKTNKHRINFFSNLNVLACRPAVKNKLQLVGQRTYQRHNNFFRPFQCTCLSVPGLNINSFWSFYLFISTSIDFSCLYNVLACRPVVKHILLLFVLNTYQQPNIYFRPPEFTCLSTGG